MKDKPKSTTPLGKNCIDGGIETFLVFKGRTFYIVVKIVSMVELKQIGEIVTIVGSYRKNCIDGGIETRLFVPGCRFPLRKNCIDGGIETIQKEYNEEMLLKVKIVSMVELKPEKA